MQVAAIYARYSDDGQRETSIEDQIRRCRECAERHGYTVGEELIFADSAITGTAKGLHKRTAFHAFLRAWDQRQFNVIVVDELARLARDAVEMAKLQQRIEQTGVRLLTTEGFDTATPHWQLQFQILAALGAHFIRETRHRVLRGMQGQLERGYMLAAPAFGYDLKQIRDDKGDLKGSLWTINQAEAALVREMYSMRKNGAAYADIAKEMNLRGIKPPRKSLKDGSDGYWRQSSVYRLLTNTIYRGVFVWNGSSFTRFKAKKEKRELKPVEYPRPELRLVDDETWNICNLGRVSRTARGGGKHIYAGLVTCGVCDAPLCVSSLRKGVRTLHCPQCVQAKRVGARSEGPGYTSTGGMEALLKHLLRQVLTGEVLQEIRSRLRERLAGGGEAELKVFQERVSKADKAVARLTRMFADTGNEHVERELRLAVTVHKQLKSQLEEVEAGLAKQDVDAIEKQVAVNPERLVDLLFGKAAPPERVRAVLSRLFPRIVALGKPSRYESHYEVCVAPGVALAEASGTAVVDDEVLTRRYRVATGPVRPVKWVIESL